ncbi:MAG: hypothetical protein ACRDI3_03795 [Actinomycetota bacterium]
MNPELKIKTLRAILAVAAAGHVVVGLSFWFFPDLAIDEILAWGPPSGWTSVLGAYDLAVAFALFLAFRDPFTNRGIIRFVGVLLSLHGLTHAYYIVWGDAPDRHWFVVAYLLAGGLVLWWLAPEPRQMREGTV